MFCSRVKKQLKRLLSFSCPHSSAPSFTRECEGLEVQMYKCPLTPYRVIYKAHVGLCFRCVRRTYPVLKNDPNNRSQFPIKIFVVDIFSLLLKALCFCQESLRTVTGSVSFFHRCLHISIQCCSIFSHQFTLPVH